MTATGYRRKLTAILSADVKGYSRLMREDEAGTVRTLNEYKDVFGSLTLQHRARVVDAVQCAVEIQRELKSRNGGLPESRRMEVRIGINLGDVIEEGDRIYGHGVNIVARLEGLADPGGICLSGTVYERTKDKVSLRFDFMGEQEVKNIPESVRAYRALLEHADRDRVECGGWREKSNRPSRARRRRLLAGVLAALVVVVGAVTV